MSVLVTLLSFCIRVEGSIRRPVEMAKHRRRQLGLEAPAKVHLAQHIASVVALSLQHNRPCSGNGGVSGGKQGPLASTLRLAEQNVADMTAYLRRRETAVDGNQEQRLESEQRNVCVICLDVTETQDEEALPCGHVFHTRCIAEWLLYRRVCPVDRQPLD